MADKFGEPLAGSTYIATGKINRCQPAMTIVYKLSEDTVRVIEFEFSAGEQ